MKSKLKSLKSYTKEVWRYNRILKGMSESEIREYRDQEKRIMHNSDEEFRAHYSMPGESLMRDLIMGKKIYDTKDTIAKHTIVIGKLLYKILLWVILTILAVYIGIVAEPYIKNYILYSRAYGPAVE